MGPQSPALELRLLGGFDVRIDGHPLPALRSRREQWLLALLVLRHDRDTAREWLASALWPDNDATQALFYLRKSLSHLRQALGAEAARLLAPTPRTVRLDLGGAFADVVAFDRALKRPETLEEAVGLYRGALLPDCPEEWAAVERNQREQEFQSALEALAARSEPAAAVHWLRRLLGADPYRESAHASLMRALADCGDLAAVRTVYQELRTRLRQELNTAPSPETEALYAHLSQRGAPAALPPPAPAQTRRRLPVPLSDLIGRQSESAELLAWMKRRRLVTLAGPGGIGKTRLAIAVAEAALPRFDDGVWFVDLAALSDPALVAQATAKALGVGEEPGRPVAETLAGALADRTLLLVLDNCEHLTEACATLAERLLSACPGLAILATSRQALGVTGEQTYPVPALPLPPEMGEEAAEKDPHVLMEFDAVRLFMDRALRVDSGFRLHRRSAPAVADICRQLDGIPLAIEMAAARLRSLSVTEIQGRLADRFRLLTSGSRGALPRQQTLRAAIDWSYDHLPEAERRLLRRLSVFAGGWSLEAARSVCGDTDEVADQLLSLVEKSLVLRQVDSQESVRYGMLETIRHYSLVRLREEEERDDARRRHLEHYLALLETIRPWLAGTERARWRALLDTEHDNLRQALAYCRDDPAAGEQGLLLGVAIWEYWDARGHLTEGRDHLEAALAHPGAQAASLARADALNAAGALAFSQGDYGAARARHNAALAIFRERGAERGTAVTLTNLGNIAATLSEFETARAQYGESLAIRQTLGDHRGVGIVLNNLGNVAKALGDYDAARAYHQENLEIRTRTGDQIGLAASLNNLGTVAEAVGDDDEALALFERSLALHRELGPPTAEAGNLASLGNIALRRGDLVAARALYEESLAIRRRIGERWGVAISLHGLGNAAVRQGDLAAARGFFAESLEIRQDLGDPVGIAESLEALAALVRRDGDIERAVRLWGAISVLQEAVGVPAREEPEEAAAFALAWEQGRALTTDEAIRQAL